MWPQFTMGGGSVYKNTNLLQIHFPKGKPPHLKERFFLRLKGLKMVFKKSSLIWNFFPDFGWNPPCFPLLEKISKIFHDFRDRWELVWAWQWIDPFAVFLSTNIFREGNVFSRVCLFTGGGGGAVDGVPHVIGHIQTCLFGDQPQPCSSTADKIVHLGPLHSPALSPPTDLFKLVHSNPPSVPHPVGKRVVGLRLKGLLVDSVTRPLVNGPTYNKKQLHVLIIINPRCMFIPWWHFLWFIWNFQQRPFPRLQV